MVDYTIETYTSPEGRLGFRVFSPTATKPSELEWGLEVVNHQMFRENLAFVLDQYEAKGSVALVHTKPPIPVHAIPEAYR